MGWMVEGGSNGAERLCVMKLSVNGVLFRGQATVSSSHLYLVLA